jgi:uncharacterized protein YndB with AHSA1/START domain
MNPRHEFTLTWTLDAPPADVFQAWTDPEQLGWFYNDEQPIPAEPIELDLRVGGAWRQQMIIDERTSYVTGGVYREIVPDEKLVFAWGAEGGWPQLDPDRLDHSPTVTVTLARSGPHTEMTVHVELPASMSEDDMPEGWFRHIEPGMRGTVDRLVAQLQGYERPMISMR